MIYNFFLYYPKCKIKFFYKGNLKKENKKFLIQFVKDLFIFDVVDNCLLFNYLQLFLKTFDNKKKKLSFIYNTILSK